MDKYIEPEKSVQNRGLERYESYARDAVLPRLNAPGCSSYADVCGTSLESTLPP